MLYFNSTSLNALLKKAMGCSKPLVFFYNKIVVTVSNEVKEKIIKSLE
jgi:hypothetical protein